jgi:arabinan endo-1,5-alpha-L-arabinosidase
MLLLDGCAVRSTGLSYSPTATTQLVAYPLLGDTQPVHDPSLINQGGKFYSFTTDVVGLPPGPVLPIRCSPNRIVWSSYGSVFQKIPAWLQQKVPGMIVIWAPDISFFNGVYHVYYAGSTLGSQRSAIDLAANATMDSNDPAYLWVDRGEVIESIAGNDSNAIDPNILVDTDSKVWMSYGSYWTGVKQLQIDAVTGLVIADAPRYNLASRPDTPNHPEEGASLVRHGEFYFLFVSVDYCCNVDLTSDNDKEAVGRGSSPHGPFTDLAGTPMLEGGGTVLLANNGTWNAPGGGTVFIDPSSGESTLIFHALNMQQNGAMYLWVKHIDWQNDWPVLTPVMAN